MGNSFCKRGLVSGTGNCVKLNMFIVALTVTWEFVLMVLMMFEFFDEAHPGEFGPLAWCTSATIYAGLAWLGAITHWVATSRHNQGTTIHGQGAFRFNVWANGVVATFYRMVWSTFWMTLGWTYYVRYKCANHPCSAFSAEAPEGINAYHRIDSWRHFTYFGFDTFRMSWFLTLLYILYLRFHQSRAGTAVSYTLVPDDQVFYEGGAERHYPSEGYDEDFYSEPDGDGDEQAEKPPTGNTLKRRPLSKSPVDEEDAL